MSSTALRPTPMGSEAETTIFEEKTLKTTKITSNKDEVANKHHIKDNNEKKSNCEKLINTCYPNYERWKTNIQILLEDEEGMRTFYEFLGTDQLSVIFDCWYSCKTYRNQHPNKAAAKEVYSRFVRIKDSRVPISDQARNNLALRLRANEITETLLLEIRFNLVFIFMHGNHFYTYFCCSYFCCYY